MIQDVGNVELFELLETDPKTQCKACLSYWSERHRQLHMRASLKRNSGPIEVLLNTHWTFFQFQNKSSRREDLTATDMGNFPGNREYHLANNLKKRCIKRDYKGIHDRFLRDHFRERMIAIEMKNAWGSCR